VALAEPPIRILFNVHFDPLNEHVPPGGTTYDAWLQQKDNLHWLYDLVQSYPEAQRPRLNLQVQGDHAEYYLDPSDPEAADGRALLLAFREAGHTWGLHGHGYVREGPHRWRYIPVPGNTPDMLCGDYEHLSDQPADRVVQSWTDHISYAEALYGQLLGAPFTITNAEMGSPVRYDSRVLAFRGVYSDGVHTVPHGFPIEINGGSECFYPLFDHSPWNPWRAGPDGPLDEDPAGHVVIPLPPVLGSVGTHYGVWFDNSVAGRQRHFLQLYLEWLYRLWEGVSDKIWVFGWHEHVHNLYATPSDPRHATWPRAGDRNREEVQEMIDWLNTHFVGHTTASGNPIATYATPDEVYRAFLRWEEEHPGESSFEYSLKTPDWDADPYLLHGVERELANARFVGFLELEDGVRGAELERCPSALRGETPGYWVGRPDEPWKPVGCYDAPSFDGNRLATTTVYVFWRDAQEPRTVDLSAYAGSGASLYDGLSGDPLTLPLSAVPVGHRPVVLVP